jgi:hypothetical protein
MLYLLMAFVEACEKKQPGTRQVKNGYEQRNSKTFKRVILHKHISYRGFFFCRWQRANLATSICCICAALNSVPNVQECDASKA